MNTSLLPPDSAAFDHLARVLKVCLLFRRDLGFGGRRGPKSQGPELVRLVREG